MKFYKTTDGAFEKHVPVIEHHGDFVLVKIGSVAHAMADVHWIEWIALETVTEPVITAYEYCNLHGLWMVKG